MARITAERKLHPHDAGTLAVGRENVVRIRYQVALNDLIAFNRYHFDHSPSMRRRRQFYVWVIPAVLLLFSATAALLTRSFEALLPGVIAAAIIAVIVPITLRWSLDRQARKLYSEGANKGILGQHELELTTDSLVERTAFGECRTRLEAIERVVRAEKYSFIYLNAMTAHVIPHDAVEEGNLEAFLDAVEQRVESQGHVPLNIHDVRGQP